MLHIYYHYTYILPLYIHYIYILLPLYIHHIHTYYYPDHSPLPDDEPRPHLVDDLDQVHPVPAVGEEVVDVEPVDVQRVDPHAEHALLSVVTYIYIYRCRVSIIYIHNSRIYMHISV